MMIYFLTSCSLCNDNAVFSIIYILKQILQVVFLLVPIILIVLVLIDIAKNVVAGKEDDMKKNKNIAIKRVIYAIVIFLVPAIVNLFMHVLYNIVDGSSHQSFLSCWEHATLNNVKQCNEEALENEKKEDEKKKQESNSKISAYENKVAEESNSKSKGLGKAEEKDSNSSNDSSSSSGSSLSEEEIANADIIYVGDSRTVAMCDYVEMSDKEVCIVKGGVGIAWLRTTETKNKLYSALDKNPSAYVLINLGVNGISGLSKANIERNVSVFVDTYKEIASKYPSAHIIAVSVGPVDEAKEKSAGYTVTNTNVNDFNTSLESGLKDTNIKYCNINNVMRNAYVTDKDGLHYTADTYKKIYDSLKSCL